MLALSALRPGGEGEPGLFSYGDFFATLNLGNSYRYALNNPFRSEFLHALYGGLSLLRRLDHSLPAEVPRLFPKLNNLLQGSHLPVVLELSGIDEARLRGEDGSENVCALIELFLESKFPGANAAGSFRAIAVSPSDIAAVHDLSGWMGFEVPEPPWQPDSTKVLAARVAPEIWANSRLERQF